MKRVKKVTYEHLRDSEVQLTIEIDEYVLDHDIETTIQSTEVHNFNKTGSTKRALDKITEVLT
jgi:hypothetical protein